MKVHELKVWPAFFEDLRSGTKTFELRKDDRQYAVGDVLHLKEWGAARGFTGRHVKRIVTHVLRDAPQFGLMSGYCILSIRAVKEQDETSEAA